MKLFLNEATPGWETLEGVWVANDYAPEGGWVQLSPFGKFPNVAGLQIVTPDDCKTVVNEFKALLSAPRRLLGLPFYIGHPDHPAFANRYTDTSAKGRIKELQCRADPRCTACEAFVNEQAAEPCPEHGLFGKVKWNDDGKRLIANQAFDGHSVNWKLRKGADGWHPVFLKSVGFTNEPNIPVAPVLAANAKGNMTQAANEEPTTLMGYVNKILGTSYPDDEKGYKEAANAIQAFKTTCNDHEALKGSFRAMEKKYADLEAKHNEMTGAMAEIHKKYGANEANEPAIKKLTEAGVTVPAEGLVVFVANELTTTRAAAATHKADAEAANARVTTAETSAANERKAHAANVLRLALNGGFINNAEKKTLEVEFANAHDATLAKIVALKPKYRVVSQLTDLKSREELIRTDTNLQSELTAMANEIVDKSKNNGRKLTWTEAWSQATKSPRGKEILALMDARKPAAQQ